MLCTQVANEAFPELRINKLMSRNVFLNFKGNMHLSNERNENNFKSKEGRKKER